MGHTKNVTLEKKSFWGLTVDVYPGIKLHVCWAMAALSSKTERRLVKTPTCLMKAQWTLVILTRGCVSQECREQLREFSEQAEADVEVDPQTV